MHGVLLCALVVGSIAAGVCVPAVPVHALAISLAAAALALAAGPVVVRLPWRRDRRVPLAPRLLTVSVGAAAFGYGGATRDRALAPPLDAWFAEHYGAEVVRAEDVSYLRGRLAHDATPAIDGVRLDLDVEAIGADLSTWRPMAGRVRLQVAGALAAAEMQHWTAGRPLTLTTHLRRPLPFRNFGGGDPSIEALRRPFVLMGTVKSAAVVEVTRGSWWAEATAAVRRRVRQAADRHLAPRDSRAAAIVTAILIGDRAGLDDDLERRLQQAGTYHVIAISGGNVAVVAGAAMLIARLLTRRRRAATALALVTVLAYGAIVDGDASVQRAVLAAAIYLVVDLAGLLPSPRHVLAVVALVLAIVDPLATIDVGAWLSFGATAGILLGVPRLRSAVAAPNAIVRAVLTLVAATLAAEIVLLPIQATVFGRLTMAGLVLNLVAIPAMAAVQVGGMGMALLTGWWNGAADVAAFTAATAVQAIVESPALLDFAPWLTWRVPPVAWGWVVVYYAAWVAVFAATGTTPRRVSTVVVSVATVVVCTAPATTWARPSTPWLRVTVLDVGQGDAILAQFPTGHAMLVDAGGGRFDIGGRVVTPAVWALGVRRLDWWVMTHGDADHVGGAAAVVQDLRPREIWEGIAVVGHPGRDALRRDADRAGTVWRTIERGHRLAIAGVEIAALSPPAPDWERRRVRNDDSVVLRISYGEVDLLLTGDAGGEFESVAERDQFSQRPRRLRILKVAHHGSRTSTSAGFVASYRPDVALISVGAANLFGHPAPEVLDRLDAAGADLFRTDRHGAVSVETDGRRVRVRTASGARWDVERVTTTTLAGPF